MSMRLNKKVAIIGSFFLTLMLLGGIVVFLKLSKDPSEFIDKAESALVQTEALIKDYEAAGDYSEEAIEAVGEAFKEVDYNYKKGRSRK